MKSATLFAAVAAYAGAVRAIAVSGAAEGFAKGVTGGGVSIFLLNHRTLLTEAVGYARLPRHY